MIDRKHKLPLTRQAKALGISRGSIYYKPRPVSDADLDLMHRIDELHLEYPFAGSRMLRDLLLGEGCKTGRLHVRTLMKRMGIEAIKGEKTLSELAQQFDVHANQIKLWRDELLAGAQEVFSKKSQSAKAEPAIDVKTLHAKIGELTLENDFLETALTKAGLLSAKK